MNTLQQLVPHLSRLELAAALGADADDTTSSVAALRAAVLFTDFAGFTSLTERLAAEGPIGAERLSEILNWYYGILTDAIARHGGDTVLFAGDALLAVFDADTEDDADATRRAAACALDIHQRLATAPPPHDATLGLRGTIGVGALTAHRVGGIGGRWLTILGGDPLDAVFRADSVARPGIVLATASAWRAIAERARGEWIAGDEVARVHELSGETAQVRSAKIPVTPPSGKGIERLVIPVLRDRLSRGQADYLSEFRDASIVFVQMQTVNPGDPADHALLHAAALATQEETARLDGTLYQMLRDDKGCSAVLAFGLPGQAHDDDPARAAEAAMAVCRRLRDLRVGAGAGIATGLVFCGAYGGGTRRNYGILGPTINRAARLMQAAGTGVVMDETTNARGARWLQSRELPPISAKGIAAPLRVFEPASRRGGESTPTSATEHQMVGRASEEARIVARISALREHDAGGAIVVEADAGMGKSTLLRRVVGVARAANLRVLEGAADSIEHATAYLAMRPVFRALLGIAPDADPSGARDAAMSRLERLSRRMLELAPLLDVVLPLEIPENELTAQMSGTIRAANLTDLLVALVESAAIERPLVLALEDLHWMDDASLQLCARIVEALPRVLVIATLRPMSPEPQAILRLTTGDGREKLLLGTMSPTEIVELIRRRLAVSSIPVAVKELILAKAEGNPFFSEELAITLRESGAIVVHGGECRLASTEALSAVSLPGTVKGVITSRIDRLAPDAQLTLKVASVLGRSVDRAMLESVHPGNGAMAESLRDLESAELLVRESDDATCFVFRHALIQETTYGLMAFAQRRPLHAAAAEYVERAHEADLTPYCARLAYHWSRADRPEKAVRYLGDAGKQALESYANQSAIDFFSEAIKLDESLRGPLRVDPLRASWHRQLAEGSYSLIEWDQARTHYEQAIELSGFPPPRFGFATPAQVFRHIGSRFAPRVVAGDPERLTAAERERCIEALRACDNLQVVYLWQGNRLSLAHTVFEGANIAARVGPSAESAFARAMLGYLLVMAGMRGTAERDLRAAVAMAEESGQLLQRVSCNMYLGMTLSLLGRPIEGIPHLQLADDLVSRLGAGLWKHRGKYMLAEPHLMVGHLDRAGELFGDCATISMSVEPPITGFANAMRALCWIRQGRVEEAIAVILGPFGIRLVRDNPIGLQLYNTLGALIEGYLWTGQWEEALAAGREGVAIPERGDDANSFFTGYNGHAAVARGFLALIERRQASDEASGLPSEAELWSLARRAVKNFRKGAKLFPGARAPYLLIEGLSRQLQGRHAAARAAWRECILVAERAGMPYEHAMATYELGRHAEDAAERASRLHNAREAFETLGMPRYAERCVEAELASMPATRAHAATA
ncbi:MAG TPA: AAA family ATPase [Gemmatimonadaceae bacterium]|nr:AAA family ATPase [Gemmatimonadaceae bacterium]